MDSNLQELRRAASLGGQFERDALARAERRAGRSLFDEWLQAEITRVNGKARTRVLDPWNVLLALHAVMDITVSSLEGKSQHSVQVSPGRRAIYRHAWAFGGTPGMGGALPSDQLFVSGKTPVLLAVRYKDRVTVGLTRCAAPNVSPGRAWKELQPWAKQYERVVRTGTAWTLTDANGERVFAPGDVLDLTHNARAGGAPPTGVKAALEWATTEAPDRASFERDELDFWLGLPRCERCAQRTDDAGPCGPCVNCKRPLCRHDEAVNGGCPHDCAENAVPYESDGALGHGFECGICGKFLQAG